MRNRPPTRHDERIIIHFDYDCFYAAVFEQERPELKSLPLAVQQKQVIVTCNYEARRRGLYKLQLLREARKACPDVVVVLGEDLTPFRNASKDNYHFLRHFIWSNKAERLGFDEVFLDVTDMIDYNVELLNHNDLTASFFFLDRNDPTLGFPFDASKLSGHTFPASPKSCEAMSVFVTPPSHNDFSHLLLRLCLGSHLAQHMRHQLEERKGYTSTVGISTNKLISKLVGNVNKPRGQTTLVPPYHYHSDDAKSNVAQFLDDHDIGKIPGIGFKIAQKIRNNVLGRPAEYSAGLVYGGTKENVTVRDVRMLEDMGPEMLERLLAGPGVPGSLGHRIWGLINGVDDTEVAKGREVPQQISIEDSYIRLDEFEEVNKELKMLAGSLVKRMRLDLTSPLDDGDLSFVAEGDGISQAQDSSINAPRRWIAHPRTLRLSTRPRPPLNPDGSRSRTFTRISRSSSMPSFVFNLTLSVDTLAERLSEEALIPLFRRLHPEKSGWNLSLVNVCATNMSLDANDSRDGAGRDIGTMFRRQENVLKEWKIDDVDIAPSDHEEEERRSGDDVDYDDDDHSSVKHTLIGSEDLRTLTQESIDDDDAWDSEHEMRDPGEVCKTCGAVMPPFAMVAHERFHALPE